MRCHINFFRILPLMMATLLWGRPGPAAADVVPTTASMVGSTDLVVEGRIDKVQRGGKALRRVTISVRRLLHSRWIIVDDGRGIGSVKRIAFTYRKPDKGQHDIDARPHSLPRLFFLKYEPDRVEGVVSTFHLELVGTLDATPAQRQQVLAVSRAARAIYEKSNR